MPLISRNRPTFASTAQGGQQASFANDADRELTHWRSVGTPAWIAYDLSQVPPTSRGIVDVVWYNDNLNPEWDTLYATASSVDCTPQNYTIEGNRAAGGGQAPLKGWVTLANVTGNRYNSRQHVVNMTGYNWLRLHVSRVAGRSPDAALNVDVYDAGSGVSDSWFFVGDSITRGTFARDGKHGGQNDVEERVHAAAPAFEPLIQSGGISGQTAADTVTHGRLPAWLSVFPGHFVGLNYGMNDANSPDGDVPTFYANMETMVKLVIAAGKIPVIPKINYVPPTTDATRSANIPRLNADLDRLYRNYPQIVKGPDFYTFFQNHPELSVPGDIHPLAGAGYDAMRQQWADTLLHEVYGGAATSNQAAPGATARE